MYRGVWVWVWVCHMSHDLCSCMYSTNIHTYILYMMEFTKRNDMRAIHCQILIIMYVHMLDLVLT